MLAMFAAALAASTMTIPGPKGPLEGTFVDAGRGAPVVVIVPGSGPTDRDGNNSLGVTAATYRMLAEALEKRGVSSVRIDKRGMFGSKAAIPDANQVTVAAYADDARAWAKAAAKRAGTHCTWVAGHSEGGLVALAAAQTPEGICGVIALASPGRRLGVAIREQLRANPANAPFLSEAEAALGKLEAGQEVDDSTMAPPLRPLFNRNVQPFFRDLLAQDPAALAGRLEVPLLIVHGEQDLQVARGDADALASAQSKAKLVVVPGASHVLKAVAGEGRAANFATYADPSLPIAPAVVDAVAEFVKARR